MYATTRFNAWVSATGFTSQADMRARKAARSSGEHVNFGWMGSGFELIDAAHPCTVRSRALEIRREQGEVAVLSYFHRV